MTIDEFIEARIDEDEAIARSTVQRSQSWQDFTMDGELRDDENAGTIAIALAPQDRAHIASHDPARVLRQAEAIRRALTVLDDCDDSGLVYQVERALAASWSTHPDYREDWAA